VRFSVEIADDTPGYFTITICSCVFLGNRHSHVL
jgi:hypothetical protein